MMADFVGAFGGSSDGNTAEPEDVMVKNFESGQEMV